MAGYYHQERKIPIFNFYEDNSGVVQNYADYQAPQTTYSYRSSQPDNASEQTYSDLLRPGLLSPMQSLDNGHEFYSRSLSHVYLGKRGGGKVNPKEPFILPRITRTNSSGDSITSNVLMAAENYFLRDLAGTPERYFPSLMSENDKVYYGTKAIGEAAPTRPEASFVGFAGEFLRDGLPSLLISSAGLTRFKGLVDEARKGGGDYLNLQFGWKPLISDFTSLLRVVQNSYKILTQYEKDSGKQVRRKVRFPIKSSTMGPPVFDGYEGIIGRTSAGDTYGDTYRYLYQYREAKVEQTQSEKVWFAGSFSYFLPVSDTLIGKISRYATLADKALGLQLTPEVLWNLAPWSWLSDWFLNIGDALSAAQRFQKDSMILNYGYLMKQTQIEFRFNMSEGLKNNSRYSPPAPPLASLFRLTQKERYRSTPYGFAVNPDLLSPEQIWILGALILSGKGSHAK